MEKIQQLMNYYESNLQDDADLHDSAFDLDLDLELGDGHLEDFLHDRLDFNGN